MTSATLRSDLFTALRRWVHQRIEDWHNNALVETFYQRLERFEATLKDTVQVRREKFGERRSERS